MNYSIMADGYSKKITRFAFLVNTCQVISNTTTSFTNQNRMNYRQLLRLLLCANLIEFLVILIICCIHLRTVDDYVEWF